MKMTILAMLSLLLFAGCRKTKPKPHSGASPSAPTLATVSPASGVQYTTVAVTLTGTNFIAGLAVNAGSDVTVSSIVVVNSTTATASLAVGSSASLGARSITVTTTWGTSNAVSFTVLDDASAENAVMLDDFESGLRIVNPGETDPIYRDFWAQSRAVINNAGAADGLCSAVATSPKAGAACLRDRVSLNNGYIQNYTYDIAGGRAWGLLKNFIVSGSWTPDTFNRVRLWLKVPSALEVAADFYYNMNIGTFVRGQSYGDWNVLGESDNLHFYNFYNLDTTCPDVWQQVILDTHPSHQRSHSGSEEYGNMPYPTGETGWGYMDGLVRFYLGFGDNALSTVPSDIFMDQVEFFQDNPLASVDYVYSLTGLYNPATNKVRVAWLRRKDEGTLNHEVVYAFSDIYTLGWANAIAAPSGTVTPTSDGAHAGMLYSTTAIDVSGHPRIYVAIRRVGTTPFNQIVIPLT